MGKKEGDYYDLQVCLCAADSRSPSLPMSSVITHYDSFFCLPPVFFCLLACPVLSGAGSRQLEAPEAVGALPGTGFALA